jgi:hypothetical protein
MIPSGTPAPSFQVDNRVQVIDNKQYSTIIDSSRMTTPPDDDWQTKALANFSFEIVETRGEDALAKWEELKTAGRGVPVVVGNLEGVLNPFCPGYYEKLKPVQETIAAASAIRFPQDLIKMRRDQDVAAWEGLRKLGALDGIEDEETEECEPPLGEWPASPSRAPGLSAAYEILTHRPLPKVHIVLVPTDDPTTVPAHLQWGNWNACPAPEYHVAALRHWREHYGAELVGLNMDLMNLRVARKPATRDEALELARVQYAYCNDMVDGSLSALAADLMAHDWWYFWWD